MKRAMGSMGCAVLLIVGSGCRTTCERHPWCHRNDAAPAPKPAYIVPPPPTPYVQQAPIQQSGGFPVLPPGALVNPPPPPPAAAVPPSMSKTPGPPNDPLWVPRESREPPLPESRRDAPPRIQLYAPEPIDRENPGTSKEPATDKPSGQRSLPAIPQFAKDKENVYAGLRPSLDGLDWLQAEGVKMVVQIRLFGEDDSAAQKQVEKRGMRYIAFEVSPEVLSKEKADEFVQLIRAGAKQGIFVYDHDGSLAGSMWYLYMRMGEVLDDDAAKIRARSLGLQANREGQHREMWLAARKLLSENSR